ncbi:superoxide dismutase family protein [Chenggangzhangella methanolivorans]|uniref:Superoxide dismutase [Cu-Zn] n=1 Tax=Chenggangzhangella methanolivorans TaxID=1437009 RepID=A0A9E6UMZ2_9HYPH|nr:superoxide dismutase family protein [Chenggangzhangella methanolivorans]QZN99658.1 superoxide dismutase family protein [Chenggangzhangella methanolivorans]
MTRTIAAALLVAALSPAAALAADAYEIMGKDGKAIGSLSLTEAPSGVLMELELQPSSMEPGKHGLHFHETADCSDVGQYKKSGSHAGHAEGKHGLLNPNGPEPGDLPNLVVGADGSAKVELFTGLIKLDGLKDANGSALIIHAKADDHKSQPIGGAGDRVACAAIK